MAALLARPAPVAALARPLSRCSSRLAAAWTAPWPQQRPQAPERDARVAARNRLAELLQDMRQEEAEEDSSVPVGERFEAPTPPPPLPPPPLLAPCFCCCRLAATLPPAHPIPPHNYFLSSVTKLEWQSPLGVLRYPDPRLRAQNARIGVFDDSLRRLAEEMFEVMYE